MFRSQIGHFQSNNEVFKNNNIIHGFNNQVSLNNIKLQGFTQEKIKFDDYEYRGELKEGIPHGLGTAYLDKFIYHGQFDNGKLTGWGIKFFKIGETQSGQYRNTIKDGVICGVLSDGVKIFGQLRNNKQEGLYGEVENDYKFFGESKNGNKNGLGVKIYNNGIKEVSLYKDNYKIGEGIQYYPDGHFEKLNYS